MGLFDFFKKAGSKALVKEETQAKKNNIADKFAAQAKLAVLQGMVKSLNIDVQNLEVNLDDDVVIVYGEVKSHEEREKIILALGNVDGIATVDDRIIVEEPPVPESQFYTVQKGDSLSKIAKEFYGDAMKYPVIFEANKPMLEDPSKIYPGQSLRIPHLQA